MVTKEDVEIAQALVDVLRGTNWQAVAIAQGYLALAEGKDPSTAARVIYENSPPTSLKNCRDIISRFQRGERLVSTFTARTRTGSAENPITKLFPAVITEQRFLELIDILRTKRRSVECCDVRESGNLADIILREGDHFLPINVKNAGTPFYRAKELVGLDPEDCVPIPAYKAFGALEQMPDLLYVVSIDYRLLRNINDNLREILDDKEKVVWDILGQYAGQGIRSAEDRFVFSCVKKYWDKFKSLADNSPFYAISARKAIRILQTLPKRTPGLGLRAWGTSAAAEINVHVSVKADMTPWDEVAKRIEAKGIQDIRCAINRKRKEEVYDPEI